MLPWLVVALALILGFLAWRLATRPILIVTNALVLPVRLQVNDGAIVELAPGDSLAEPLARGSLATVAWSMVQPRTRSGALVGSPLGASEVIPAGRGKRRYPLRAMRGDTAYFAPLITNATGVPLSVRINAGLAGAEDCRCEVPPAARRMAVGYYRLYRNSTVEVRDSAGRRAMFRDLGPETDPASGVVGLRFEARDLR